VQRLTAWVWHLRCLVTRNKHAGWALRARSPPQTQAMHIWSSPPLMAWSALDCRSAAAFSSSRTTHRWSQHSLCGAAARWAWAIANPERRAPVGGKSLVTAAPHPSSVQLQSTTTISSHSHSHSTSLAEPPSNTAQHQRAHSLQAQWVGVAVALCERIPHLHLVGEWLQAAWVLRHVGAPVLRGSWRPSTRTSVSHQRNDTRPLCDMQLALPLRLWPFTLLIAAPAA
jgi:hypothetical protein